MPTARAIRYTSASLRCRFYRYRNSQYKIQCSAGRYARGGLGFRGGLASLGQKTGSAGPSRGQIHKHVNINLTL